MAAALGLGWLALREHRVPATTLSIPAVAFLAAVVVHDRVARRRARAGRAVRLYELALARLDGQWDRQPDDGSRFLDPHHPYAADLDLFGPHSLFQLLNTTRTAPGEATLAQWLTEPARADEIEARQDAVKELRPRLDMREALWIAGHAVRASVDAPRLAAWGVGPPLLPWAWTRPLLFVVAAAISVLGGGWLAGLLPAAPAALAAAVVLALTQILHRRTSAVVDAVARPDSHLALLAALARVFERERELAAPGLLDHSPKLRELHERLTVDGQRASRQIARLSRLVSVLSWQHNLIFTPIGYALLWRPQLAAAIEAWRRRNGPRVAVWIQALAELEALVSLATFSYDHPERPFPRMVEPTEGPVFYAESLGHPLLPHCVTNDIRLGGAPGSGGPRLMMLSGSNMSGKSTLMRTVGVNAVLALAGAPVYAARLILSVLMPGATLRVQDSLAAGTSRFYAEVKRLRELVDLARGPTPLLFLIDELLAGTNSHDRRLGALAVLTGLVKLGAIGIASTHDLALTEVTDELPGQASNYHFQDELHDGVLTFDYRLRPGIVQHSNALALMRAVGLDV